MRTCIYSALLPDYSIPLPFPGISIIAENYRYFQAIKRGFSHFQNGKLQDLIRYAGMK
jgi:hypothetical protein